MVEASFVRSRVAHGRIVRIDTSAASAARGVVAVATAGDLDGVSPVPHFCALARPVGIFPLCRERVRYVGALWPSSWPGAIVAPQATQTRPCSSEDVFIPTKMSRPRAGRIGAITSRSPAVRAPGRESAHRLTGRCRRATPFDCVGNR